MSFATQLRTAAAIEWAKFRRASIVWVTGAFLVLGVPMMSALTLVSANGSNPLLAAKADALTGGGGWTGFFAAASAIVAVGGLLGFGVVVGWTFGREFTDGTISSLFATPVTRTAIAAAKLLILVAWQVSIALLLGAVLLGAGFLFAGPASGEVLGMAFKLLAITVTTGLLSLPCAWAATLGRGYLAAIGAIIAVVILSQMAVMAGVGHWFAFAAPGMWAATPGSGSGTGATGQLLVVLAVAFAAAALTLNSWRRLRIDR